MTLQLVTGITWAGTRSFIDRWSVAEWLVAVGTIGLAVATFVLVTRVARQVKVERDQLVAGTRPLVVPTMGDNFDRERYRQTLGELYREPRGPHLRLQNSGAGPALNVRGSLYWTQAAGGASALHPIVLAANAEDWVKVLGEGIEVNWATAVGFLRYHDLRGTEWQTHFRFRTDGSGNVRVETVAVGATADFGEPGYNAEVGWTNRPSGVKPWVE